MSSEEQPKTAAEPVGQQLRRARERQGLSLSAIADQQHLRTSVIEAIEDGDFSKVDTELFLKGYVRAYAQHVGLNADAIIRDLDAELEPLRKERERQHDADPLVDIERKKSRKRRAARAVVVILTLVVIGFAVSAYLADGSRRLPGFSNDQGPETSENAPEAEADSVESPIQDAQLPVDTATEAPDALLSADSQAGTPEAGGSKVMVSPVEIEADAASRVPSDSPVEVAEVIEPESSAMTVADPEQETVTEPASAADEIARSSARLRMTFNDDCWVQVTDAEGNRLASSLRMEGDVLEVSGEAPLSIVVGAVSALDALEFQGEAVDLNSIRTVNNRAEFTLEP